MVTTLGNAVTGYTYDTHQIDLPRETARLRPAHQTWCTDCKRKGLELDGAQRCEKCARAVVSRAAQRERWAQAEKEERRRAAREEATRPRPKPKRRAPRAAGRQGAPRVDLPVADLIAAYQAGAKMRDLAEQYGCSKPTIQRRLVEAGVEIRRDTRRVDTPLELVEQVCKLYVDGKLSLTDTATRLGITQAVVARVVREAGHTVRGRGDMNCVIPIEERDAVADAYRAGARAADLAEQYGVTTSAIHSLLARLKIDRHPNGRRPTLDIDVSAIIREYEAGATAPDLAQRYSCTPKRIRAILDRNNVRRRDDRAQHSGAWQRKLAADPLLVDEICTRYAQGATVADLATFTGHGRRQITNLLRDAGVTIRRPVHEAGTRLTAEQIAEAVQDYLSGMPLGAVGKKWSLRPTRIRDYVLAAGHEIRVSGDSAHINELLHAHGLTARQVKEWAVATGRLDQVARGRVQLALITAYLEHHQKGAAA